MASSSYSHAAGPKAQTKSSSVTAQHTLERVRNNQRRHRARRRDYITTLEQKLTQAEQSVTTFKTRSSSPLPNPRETALQAFGLHPDAVGLEVSTLSTPLSIQLQLDKELCVDVGPDAISPHFGTPNVGPKRADGPTGFEISQALVPLAQSTNSLSETLLTVVPELTGFGGGRHSSLCSNSDLALQTTDYHLIEEFGTLLSMITIPDSISVTTAICCSEGESLKPDDNKIDGHAVVLSRENQFQPAIEAHYEYNTAGEGESTILCAEAYLLIEQQNFRGVSQEDVATWLWQGFRKSVRRDEGCRVKTDLLFSLLGFISDG